MKISKATIEVLIDRQPVARLATLGADLTIHQVPIVFARHYDKSVHSQTYQPLIKGQIEVKELFIRQYNK